MSLAGALGVLDGLTIAGVTTSYGYDAMPGVLGDALLPALVIEPFDTFNDAMRAANVNADVGSCVVWVRHKLIIKGVGLGPFTTRLSVAVTLFDAYITAIAADMTLSGNLLEPLTIPNAAWGAFEHVGAMYWGIVFDHRWVLNIS